MNTSSSIKHLKTEINSEISPRRNVTVRFKPNEFETIAQVYLSSTTIESVLDDIATKFQLLPKYLSIRPEKNGQKFSKNAQLKQLVSNSEFGILDVQLGLSDLANHINESIQNDFEKIRLDTELYYRQYRLPDFISVTVPDKNNPTNFNRVVVEIVNDPIIKPFLGGYVNKLNGIEYHNAYSQTGPLKERLKYDNLITRDSQTEPKHLNIIQGSVNIRNHMKSIIRLNNPENKFTELQNQMATVIQRNFRWYQWKKLIKQSSIEWKQLCSEENSSSNDPNIIVDAISLQTPRDFEMFKSNIRRWKENQCLKIKDRFPDKTQRQVEFNKLLEQEIKFLNYAETKRNQLNKQNQEKQTEMLLEKMGTPITWIGYKNIRCEMDTLKCQKIRKLTTFYHQLKTINDKIDRIEFIHELCNVLIEESPSTVLKELIEMLRREEKMLLANVDEETLFSLQCRQRELFRGFILNLEH